MTRNAFLSRLALLQALLLAAPPPAAAKVRSDWSKVRMVEAGRPAVVLFYADEAPAGARKIKGRFESAAAESITLVLQDGQTLTFEKRVVRKILVRRPFAKRWPGWAALGISSVLWGTFVALMQDMPASAVALSGSFVVPPTVAFFAGSRMGGIYNVPPKHRAKMQAAGADDSRQADQGGPR